MMPIVIFEKLGTYQFILKGSAGIITLHMYKNRIENHYEIQYST